MSKILYISSEAFPLVKTGGLGDVAGSLPGALLKNQQDVRLLLPAYRGVLDKLKHTRTVATCHYYDLTVNIIESKLPGSLLKVWLVDCPALFDRPGGPYTNQHGHVWEDNALRFALFCHAAVSLAMDELNLNWRADIVHCNDWQTGLIPALLSLRKTPPASVFTIHNLAYQGNFDAQTFNDLHLPGVLWHINGLEFYNQLSFIKGGLCYADKINTVSPTYADEICTAAHGYGMQGLLQHRKDDLSGILNGIDTRYWNPGTDEHLVQKYNSRSLSKKLINKQHLQKHFGLTQSDDVLMIGMVSRMVEQKGFDIILESLPELLEMDIQLVILGTGDTHYEIQLSEWAQQYKEKMHVSIGYDEALAHQIEAASDLYMMPSRFEPCGLNQMYSLRYATLPVVTAVGGLEDTVIDAGQIKATISDIKKSGANGFKLMDHSATQLVKTCRRALAFYNEKEKWKALQHNAMSQDHSWQASAEHYLTLYQQASLKNKT